MSALPYSAETVFRWRHGRDEIAATAIAAFDRSHGRSRAVLTDASGRHWLAEIGADGALTRLVAGPISVPEALHAADMIVAGIADHRSVTGLVVVLAVGLVARAGAEGVPT